MTDKVLRVNKFDDEYFRLATEILYDGEKVSAKQDRTGLGYINKFNTNSQLDMRDGFPLITTKKVDYEAVKAELFWMLSGSTNVNDLPEKYRFIWQPWASEDGSLGRIYQSQWLNWKSFSYEDRIKTSSLTSLKGPQIKATSINQIQQVLDSIKTNPHSRRHLISAWNVAELNNMALQPCHYSMLFNVSSDCKWLDLQVQMRSNDFCIGKPYNWAQYGTILAMFAKECGMSSRYLCFSVGSDHIYLPHIEKVKEQVIRKSHKPPTIKIANKSFWKLTSKDIELVGYEHERFIKYTVAV